MDPRQQGSSLAEPGFGPGQKLGVSGVERKPSAQENVARPASVLRQFGS
ncbi:MAG: hypothetical protein RL472_403 [Pseudomonadota bacterium]